MTIPSAFNSLLENIEPTGRDSEVYANHQHSVTRRLETAFAANRVELIGSYSRGSSIRHTSDIDLLLVMSRDEVRRGEGWKSSTTVLGHVRDELLSRYPNTDVVRDVHAVVVRFADNQHPVDVVPGFYWQHGGAKNYPVFAIPDGKGGWMLTSPQAHNKYIREADERSGGKLKRVAKLIKFWRRCRQPHIPLSSFHVELLLAHEDICAGAKSYALCLNNTFATLANRNCQPLTDPMGIAGEIPAAYTEDKRRRVQDAVMSSAKRAFNALEAEAKGNVREAARLWDLIFNGNFPNAL
jgi:Second Messenger Oligonucleotide or Dinucleotide Synthetase domain